MSTDELIEKINRHYRSCPLCAVRNRAYSKCAKANRIRADYYVAWTQEQKQKKDIMMDRPVRSNAPHKGSPPPTNSSAAVTVTVPNAGAGLSS